MALIRPGFPVLAFPPVDGAATGIGRTVALFVERGARVAVAGAVMTGAITLPILPGMHPALAPIAMVQSLYALIDALARRRGLDPDHPPMLNKVTRTL